jgi:hypothetical protein
MDDIFICTMAEKPDRRTRTRCPYHRRLCYGTRRECYDTWYTFFDCGTTIDHGARGWKLPPGVGRRRWLRERKLVQANSEVG